MSELMKLANVFDDASIGNQFSSFSPDDFEGKVRLYNAINSPDKRLGDYINTPIVVKDTVVMSVELSDKKDDKDDKDTPPEGFVAEDVKRQGFRVILIDTDGISYTATSNGIYNSVKTLLSVFGTLHFEEGLQVIVKQVKTKNGNTLTLSLK